MFSKALISFTDVELSEMNRQIVDEIKMRHTRKQMVAARQYVVGDCVQFMHGGRLVRIRIEKFNTKTMSGPEVDHTGARLPGRGWRVSPTAVELFVPVTLSKVA